MKDKLLKTKKEANEAVSCLRDLLTNRGWQLLCEVLDENISLLTSQLLDGVPGEDMGTVYRLRNKLEIHRSLRELPEKMITELSTEDKPVDPDPYDYPKVDKDSTSGII